MDGTYTTKAGYQWLLDQLPNSGSATNQGSWNWIWALPCPEKIKFFIWTACYNSIPTMSMLHHRGMKDSPGCSRCGSGVETVLHCLRDCTVAKNLWLALGVRMASFYHESDPIEWFRSCLEALNPHTFVSAVWWIWRARCSSCIANETIPTYQLRVNISNLSTLLTGCFNNKAQVISQQRLVSWHPSRDNDIILNVDGSSIGNPGPAGFGGLFRGKEGNWICGFAGSIGHANNMLAELMALYLGLNLAWNKGYRVMTCYSDSLNVIHLVNTQVNMWHAYAPLIQNIVDLLNRNWSVTLRHSLREGNACADCLAKIGAHGVHKWVEFESPPPELLPHLLADASGVEFPRL